MFTQDCTSGCVTPRLKQTSCSYIALIIHLQKDLPPCCNFLLSYERSSQYKTLLNVASKTRRLWFIQTFYFAKDHHLTFHRMLSKNCGSCFTRTEVLGRRSHLFHKLRVQIFSSIWLIGLDRSNHFFSPFFLECYPVGFIPQSILAIYIPQPLGRSVSSTCHQSHPPQSRSLLREGIKMDRAN